MVLKRGRRSAVREKYSMLRMWGIDVGWYVIHVRTSANGVAVGEEVEEGILT